MPERVDQCVGSVLEDNPDLDESTAHAICQDLDNRGLLTGLGEDIQLAVHSLKDPGRIERVEENDDRVRYKDVMLLAPGVWTDAASQEPVYYNPSNFAENWSDDRLNFLHEQDDDTWRVGRVDTDTVYTDDENRLYADLVLDVGRNAGALADEALQKALETGGREGVEGPSVEIQGFEYEYNAEYGAPEIVSGEFMGAALVGVGISPGPASETASFEHQVRERAVALGGEGHGAYRILTRLSGEGDGGCVSDTVPDAATELASRLLQDADLNKQEVADLVADAWDGLDPSEVLSILDEAQEQEAASDDDDEDEEEEMASDDDEEDEEELAADADDEGVSELADALDERFSDLEETVTELAAHEALEDRLGELEESVQALADREQPPKSHATTDGDGDDSDHTLSDSDPLDTTISDRPIHYR